MIKIEHMIRRFGWLISFIFLFGSVYAQKVYNETGIRGYKSIHDARVITDTLDQFFDTVTVTIYGSPSGGHVSGNSGYNEIAKAQRFNTDSISYDVYGFLYWFGYKEMQSEVLDSSYITLTMWKFDTIVYTVDSIYTLPRTVSASAKLYIDDLVADTNYSAGLNVWTFSAINPIIDYAGGFSMEGLHIKDTIAVFSSSNGDPPISNMSWEKWSGTWNTIKNAWGLDIDFAIFPLVDFETAGIEDAPTINGIKYSIYPNPTTDFLSIDLRSVYDGTYQYIITDMNGKLIQKSMILNDTINQIDVSTISSGNYIITVVKDNKGYAQKWIKR